MAGFNIPAGSLNIFADALAASNAQRVEIVAFGDSTTADSGADYSWLYEAARLASVDGFTYGGRGMGDGSGDTAMRSGPIENLACFTDKSGFTTASDSFDFFGESMFRSNVVGDSVVFQGNGSCRIHFTKANNRGRFSYAVNGGGPVIVDAFDASLSTDAIYLPLSDALNHVAVENLGSPLGAPSMIGGDLSGPGQPNGFSDGTYWFKVTGLDGTGETTPGAGYGPFVVPNGPRTLSAFVVNNDAFDSYNVYRATSEEGPYEFVFNVTRVGGTYTQWIDDNTATPGAEPPTENTAGADPGKKDLHILCDFVKAAGLVWHKNAISGAQFFTFGLSDNETNNFQYQVSLGLTQSQTGSGGVVTAVPASKPPWRGPKLAICALGINMQQPATEETKAGYISATESGVQIFIDAARAAGADPLVVIPHFKRAVNGDTMAADFTAAVKGVAEDNAAAWIDFDFALDEAEYAGGGPHLDQAGYNIEAAYFWDVLKTLAPAPSGNADPARYGDSNNTLLLKWAMLVQAATPVEYDLTISEGGNSTINGGYTERGTNEGKSYYNKYGQPDSLVNFTSYFNGEGWVINDGLGVSVYAGGDSSSAFPWEVTFSNISGNPANDPPPTVTEG